MLPRLRNMTLLEKIENIAGPYESSGATNINAYRLMINSFLKQSARAVLLALPDEVLIKDSIKININDGTGIDVTDKKVLKVLRDGYGAVEMPLEMKRHMQSGSRSIYEPTLRSPIYYIEGQTATGGKLFIKPDPTTSQIGSVDYNSYPSPVWSNTGIGNFPDTAEYAVVLGAGLKLLQHKMNIMIHDDEDIELAHVAQQELLNIQTMYNEEIVRLGGTPVSGGSDGSS